LTELTHRLSADQHPNFWFDLDGERLTCGRTRVPLSPKAFSLVGVLTLARLLQEARRGTAWVSVEEIGRQDAWSSGRTPTSLRRQIRREIEDLIAAGVDVIEWDAKTRGPFRLGVFPKKNLKDMDRLAERFFAPQPQEPPSSMAFGQWLHSAEKALRADYSFDKSDDLLHAFQEPLALDEQEVAPGGMLSTGSLETHSVIAAKTIAGDAPAHEPLIAAKWEISKARRLRDMGDFIGAHRAIDRAMQFAQDELSGEFREFLVATCVLQRGWISYREGQFRRARRLVKTALKQTDGRGFLRLQGQIMSLKSILLLRDGHTQEAFHDLWLAARYFLIEGDPYNFFSIFHNLGCWVAEVAARSKDGKEHEELLREAAKLCSDSARLCTHYGIAKNSAISYIKAAALLGQIDPVAGLRDAKKAFDKAL
jgi:tetratricopeptide (TPR) repeat protein